MSCAALTLKDPCVSFNRDAVFWRAAADSPAMCFTGLCLYQSGRRGWKIPLATEGKCWLLGGVGSGRSCHWPLRARGVTLLSRCCH